MWRAFFLAAGTFLILLGLQCLGVQKFILKAREPVLQQQQTFVWRSEKPKLGPKKEVTPPPWAPWSLMSTGAVVCLYSFSIPNRVRNK